MKIIKYDYETLICTCNGCPSIYEFKDEKGDNYFFRLRHGYWRLENEETESIACEGNSKSLGLDGVCTWEEAIQLIALENVQLLKL